MMNIKNALRALAALMLTALVSHATEVGKPFPEFTLKDIQGRPVSLSQFKGKTLLLDFWMTTCPPCKQEMPVFQKLKRKYRNRGLVVVGISLDDNVGVVKEFTKKIGVNYTILMHPTLMVDDSESRRFGIIGLPTTYIIDRDGIVRSKVIGFEDEEAFEKAVQQVLPQ